MPAIAMNSAESTEKATLLDLYLMHVIGAGNSVQPLRKIFCRAGTSSQEYLQTRI